MPLHLPSRPNLARLKREAKALLAAIRSGDEQPLMRLRTLFSTVTPQTAKLSEVQTLLARAYGFASWTVLGDVIEKRGSQIKAKAARLAARAADAADLAARWFTLAEAGDLDTLWRVMGVGKTRSEVAQKTMRGDRPRYDRFVSTVIEGLGYPNSRARFEYAHVLDSFGDERCVAPLRALMNDPVPRVRWMAMHAITCHACGGATCPDDPELIAEILHHLHNDESIKVRRHAAIALGEAGRIDAKATLEAVVAEAADPGLVRFALYALRELSQKAAA